MFLPPSNAFFLNRPRGDLGSFLGSAIVTNSREATRPLQYAVCSQSHPSPSFSCRLELLHNSSLARVLQAFLQACDSATIMSQTYTTLSAALTTVFAPPASCASSWTYEAETFNAISGGLLIQNALTDFDTSCWPASFTGNGRANGRAPSPIQLYSPGICPSGYTTAGGFTESGTTSGICCLQ